MNPDKSFPIVAIGASAGGLYSLECFIAALPKDFSFALIFMQHLSPKHKSLLPGLLRARNPDLEIEEVSEGPEVVPGKLYLCPPGKNIRIQKGVFHVESPPSKRVSLPIDELFFSLSEEAENRAIAVIFSGAGTDGARGIQAIRNMGGTVIVQDPDTAEFDGMPRAAVGTGRVDGVFSPEDIAREVLKLCDTDAVAAVRDSIDPSDLEAFYRVILEKTGYRFSHYKRNVVTRRIKRRMYLRGIAAVKRYLQMIAENDSEAVALASDLMIGVTSFFRDRLAWKALNIGVIRKLSAEDEDSPVRVWTPACATGEEAYSIAMMLHNEFNLAGRKREIQVFATDINDRALDKAREGTYPGSIAADVSADFMRKYFTCSEDGLSVVIGKEIREQVVFARQDLLTDPPFSRLDLIICRNFLIYLEPDAQEKCMALFHYALKDGGYLFLGNAESVGKNKQLFKSVSHKKCRLYQKREMEAAARPPLAVPFAAERDEPSSFSRSSAEKDLQTSQEFVQEVLLEEYAPASVAIDQNYNILYFNGPTNRYLSQPRGAPTRNLLELMPESLHNRFRGGFYRTSQEEKKVAIRTSIVGDDKKKRQVTLRISKLRDDLFLIVFLEKDAPAEHPETLSADVCEVEDSAIRQLESELSATRAELQSNIEQLKSLNEELQSSNEELHAANEELETSREELQSLNEELITVNSQLQSKIEEQEETNNDLNNFLASTNIPTVFLDDQFRVRRFTPAISKFLKLIPPDIGRPISDLSRENLGPDLITDAQAVLDHLVPINKEMMINGISYIRSILPYRTSDNRIEGVVVTYGDVTELKRAEELTRHLASFPQVNPNPVIELDSLGKITFFNPGTQKILEDLGLDKGDVAAFLPEDLHAILRDWDKKTEATVYREITVADKVFGSTMHLVPQFDVVRIYAHDISAQKRTERALLENEGRLKRSQEIAHLGSWELDLVNNVLTWSDEVYRIFGLEPGEFAATYEAFLERVHPDDRAAVDAAYSGSLKEGRDVYEIEHRVVRKNTGETRYVHEKCEHFRDESATIIRSVGMIHDITERRQTEKALRESEEQFRTLADSIPQLCWAAGSDGYITWYNRRWYDYTGTTPEQMEGWGWQSVHDPGVLPKVLDRWKASISTGEPFEMEFPLRGADGIFRPFLTRVRPLKDAAGRVIRWFGTNTDITALKRAEEALRRSERRYRSFVEVTSQFGWVTDPAGQVVEDIPSLREFTGQTYEQARGAGWADALHPDDVQRTLDVWNKAVATRTPYETEYRMRRHDGEYRLLLARGVPIFDDRDNVTEWVGTCIDITERKKAEESLKLSLNRFELLTVTAGELLQSTEPQDVVESICRKVMEYLDCDAFFNFLVDEQSGRLHLNASAGIPEEEAKRLEWLDFGAAVCGCVARDGKRIVAEHIPATPDRCTGLVKSLGITAYCCHPMLGPGGMVIGTLSFGTCSRETFSEEDLALMKAVTDQVAVAMIRKRNEQDVLRLSEEMAERNVELEAVNRELEAFIYSISHDLRAPLRAMSGFSKILVEDYAKDLDAKGKDYLDRIHRGSEKMTHLIDDLLNLSRISRQEMTRTEIDMSLMAASIISDTREAHPDRSVDVSIDEGLKASADRGLIEIVLLNLLENAWKFTSKTENARIEFGAITSPTSPTVYYVKDNGAGFDPNYVDKLFRPFHRLHSDGEFEGTGVGLTIVDRIIRRHGGRVWAEAEVGKGATVLFTLS
jgi:two-component system CheB/CheR fusion protein